MRYSGHFPINRIVITEVYDYSGWKNNSTVVIPFFLFFFIEAATLYGLPSLLNLIEGKPVNERECDGQLAQLVAQSGAKVILSSARWTLEREGDNRFDKAC